MAAEELSVPDPMAAASTLVKASGGGGEDAALVFGLGIAFSAVGFIGLTYGRRTGNLRAMALGGALMIYPYLVNGLWPTIAVGAVLSLALWRAR